MAEIPSFREPKIGRNQPLVKSGIIAIANPQIEQAEELELWKTSRAPHNLIR